MGLTKEAIEEFKELYHREFAEKISNREAQEMGENLLSLFHLIYRPIPGASKERRPNPDDKVPESV